MDLPWTSIAGELLKSVLGPLLAVIASWSFYKARRLPDEREWIKCNGVMLWVVYRTIQWRCERLKAMVTDQCCTFEQLRVDLQKLRHDLDAFDGLIRMWERRNSDLSYLWNPYAKSLREVVDRCDTLVLTLRRHIGPILDAGGGDAGRSEELKGYCNYFLMSEPERMFGTLRDPSHAEVQPSGEAFKLLQERRRVTLADQLTSCAQALQQGVDIVIPSFHLSKKQIWPTKEAEQNVPGG